MSLKKLGAATFAVLLIGAVMASSAFATATTTASQWYTGASPGTTLATGTSQTITAKIGTNPTIGKKFELESELGTNSVKTKLTATEVSCTGCTIANKVASKGGVNTSSSVVATGTGTITFKGVTVDEPAGCTVESSSGVAGDVTSNPLTVHADFMEGEKALQQFFPTSGETFATFKLSGETCSVTGTYLVKGSLFSEATNKTGVQATEQSNNFSPEINKNAGGELKIGSKIAKLTGTGIFETTNSKGEKVAFGIH